MFKTGSLKSDKFSVFGIYIEDVKIMSIKKKK